MERTLIDKIIKKDAAVLISLYKCGTCFSAQTRQLKESYWHKLKKLMKSMSKIGMLLPKNYEP
jgi:pyruvate/oxaloacetate carboxyltransferase